MNKTISISSKADIIDSKENTKKYSLLNKFKKIYIIFWIYSVIGHYVEIVWALSVSRTLEQYSWRPKGLTMIPVAVPYGLGVIAMVMLVIPLMKRYKLHPIAVFVLATLITGAIEYLSAMVVVLVYGRNDYWDYSGHFLNINGYVCLQSVLLFSLLSSIYVYFIHSHFMKFYNAYIEKHETFIFWTLYLSYFIDLTYALMA